MLNMSTEFLLTARSALHFAVKSLPDHSYDVKKHLAELKKHR